MKIALSVFKLLCKYEKSPFFHNSRVYKKFIRIWLRAYLNKNKLFSWKWVQLLLSLGRKLIITQFLFLYSHNSKTKDLKFMKIKAHINRKKESSQKFYKKSSIFWVIVQCVNFRHWYTIICPIQKDGLT